VGPNGIGKSTFLDLLTEKVKPDAGTVSVGSTVILGVFGQQGLEIKEDKRIIEVVRDIADVIPLSKGKTLTASALLERFLFDKEQQFQYVSTLSGGEKRRLYLCTVLMKNPNVLVLDEPTNDLDIPTLNALEDFLRELDICLLVVSHDRFFMDKICTKLLVFEGEGKIKEWVGSYTELREMQKARELQAQRAKNAETEVKKAESAGARSSGSRSGDPEREKMTFGEKNELKKLDKEVPALEKKKEELLAKIAASTTDHHAIMQLSIDLEKAVKELDTRSERWLVLMEKAEAEAKAK
jgi:ATP-binding cassette subfamily F protein uup